jgi:hypothetical protein
MILADDDAALFYRAWGALLTWVNDRRRVVPSFRRPTPEQPMDAERAIQIRDVLWADDGLREQFLGEGAGALPAAERELIASWKHRVSGSFLIYNHLRAHSTFMGAGVYGVRGIYTPLSTMFPAVPTYVEAVLLPFRDVIIIDGLVSRPSMQISFGAGARRMFKEQYDAARTRGTILTRLPAAAAPVDDRTPPRPKRTRGARTPARPGKARLAAMIEEATVDAHGDMEKATGWFTMFEHHLALPFTTQVLGATVTVAKLELRDGGDIVAICTRGRDRQAVLLVDLPLPSPRPTGAEWIEAYRAWRGGR